jgi:hypothetical protein
MAIITEERDLLQDHVTKVEQAFEELKKRYEMRKSENEKMQKVIAMNKYSHKGLFINNNNY